MASHKSVVHVQRGFRMSKAYAEQVMREHCSIAWVVKGETIRDTTDEERVALRADQAQKEKSLQPLAFAEIHGLTFSPSVNGVLSTRLSPALIRAAHAFCAQAA